MTIDLGGLIARAFKICWRNRWMAVLGAPTGGGGASGFIIGELVLELALVLGVLVGAALSGTPVGTVVAVVVAIMVGVGVVAGVFYVAAAATAGVLWGGLALDSAVPTRGRDAWREGRRRAPRYIRLLLLQLITYVVPFALLGVPFFAGVTALGPKPSTAAVVLLLVGMGVGELVAFLVILGCQLMFGWAPALAMLRDLGALASYRESWRLVLRHKLDSFLLFLVAVFALQFLSIFVFVVALLAAVPGLVLVGVGLATNVAAVTGIGAALAILGWLAGLLLTGGFLGAVQQLMYVLGCRDLELNAASPRPAPTQVAAFDAGLPPARVPA